MPLKNAKGAGAGGGGGGAEKKFVIPPPKPQRVFNSGVADSRMNTTIRDTVMRLYSSSSETSETSELTSSSSSSAARHVIQQQPTPPTKPASLPLSQQRSSTSQKPLPSPKPKSPKKAPTLLYPEQALALKRGGGGGGGQRNRIAAVAGSSGKSASFDEGDVQGHGGSSAGQGRRLGSSNSDSSSANTVFTSDRGSPSAVSDISVFSAENLMYDAIIMGTDQQRRHDLDKRLALFPRTSESVFLNYYELLT